MNGGSMPYVNNNGINIYYEVHGDGIPVILLLGLGGSLRIWDHHVREFPDNYKIILVDNRGVGNSDKPDEEYSLEIFAEDIKCILDSIGIKKANMLGLSMGGFIAQRFYSLYPEMINSLILGCTGMGLNDPANKKFSANIEKLLHEERTEENHGQLIRLMQKHFFYPEFRKNNPDFMDIAFSISRTQPQPFYSYKRQLMACYAKTILSPLLSNIKAPTLVLHGDSDEVAPIENAHYLHKHIPDAELEIFKQSGHMFFIEKQKEFSGIILNFLHKHNHCNAMAV